MSERQTERVCELRPNWVTLVGPLLLAPIGVAVFKYGRDFFTSREGVLLQNGVFGSIEPVIGPDGVKMPENSAEPAAIILLFLLFGLPLIRALILRATTSLGVDSRQIIRRRGVIARDITRIEIGEIVGVNVSQSLARAALRLWDRRCRDARRGQARDADVGPPPELRRARARLQAPPRGAIGAKP